MRFWKLFLLVALASVFVFLSIHYVHADVISINGGGDSTGNVVVNPDTFIENFFSGVTYCGDGVVQNPDAYGIHEQCDLGNQNGVSGSGCSSSCQTVNVTQPPSTGGGGAVTNATLQLRVNPSSFNLDVAVNGTTAPQKVTVTNYGDSAVSFNVVQQNMTNRIIVSYNGIDTILGQTNMTIPAGSSITFEVSFRGLQTPGIYTGKLNVGGQEINVALNVRTQLLLFDSNIVVLNKNLQVQQGSPLQTRVTLIPQGDKERIDVTLNFVIKDFTNKVYLTKSETILVQNETVLNRNFDTGALPIGDYVVGLELVYPNGVAPSSARFSVVQKPSNFFGNLVIVLLVLIIVILILIIILIIHRRRRLEKNAKMHASSNVT